jgi:WD40 repeat protein
VFDAEFSHDGKWIVTASKNGNVRVWDVASGQLVGSLMRPRRGGAHRTLQPR